jgi:hypothetical protein
MAPVPKFGHELQRLPETTDHGKDLDENYNFGPRLDGLR